MFKERLHNSDIILFTITVFLVVIGIVMVYSASAIMALEKYNNSNIFFTKQLMWAFGGFILMFFLARYDYHKLHKISFMLLTISIILLVMVLIGILNSDARGVHRWIRLGPIGVQPSEVAKISLIIYLADFIDRKQSKIKNFRKGIIPVLIILGIICLLILKGKDLGTPVLLATVGCFMLFIGGAKIWHLIVLFLMSLPVLYFSIFHTPYRMKRLWVFLNPFEDVKGVGYQIYQSLIALGSGGFRGVGLGNSIQKLLYLPELHTDFIFPIIGEELGFIGSVSIIILFIIFVWRGIKIALFAPDLFGSLLAGGITFLIGLQVLINIGVVTGSLPTKGLPLPFLSFGGSYLICTMAGVGILLNVSKHTK